MSNSNTEKNSFVLYKDMIHTVKKMTDRYGDSTAGKLFLAILEYANGNDMIIDDFVVDLVFEPIKQTMKRNDKKWGQTVKVRSQSGKMGNLKRWNPDLYDKVSNNEITFEESQSIANDRKTSQSIANIAVSVSDSVNGSDTVSDNVIESESDILLKKETKKDKICDNFSERDFKSVLRDLGVEKKHIDGWLSNRRKKRLAATETALNGFLKQAEKTNLTLNDVVRICGEEGWGGFKSNWLQNIKNKNYGKNPSDKDIYSDDFKQGLFEKLQS